MNKQIEEMAKVIHKAEMNDIIAKVTGDIEDLIDCAPTNEVVAEALYNAGYRKTSAVAREIFEEIEKTLTKNRFRGTSCLLHDIAELKKKYESEGADDV